MKSIVCDNCKKNFDISADELSLYEKVGVVLPTICYFCRIQLHFAFWNFGKFRKGVSALTGESLITTLSEKIRYPLCTLKEWYSDIWDPMSYGTPYDESKSFFEQLTELQGKVPRPHQSGTNNTGCDWSDDVWNSKNCYLSRSIESGEDLQYSYRLFNCKNSVDCAFCFESDNCYDSSYCYNSYNLQYSKNSRDCLDSYFLFDCRNSNNCFMSYNLRGKQYCFRNEQLTKEEYQQKVKECNLDSYEAAQVLKKEFDEMVKNDAVHRENYNIKSEASEGEFLSNTKNCKRCFIIHDCEDCCNCSRGTALKNCVDANGCWHSEAIGNCSSCLDSYMLKYSLWSSARNSEYVDLCIECEYCFGCVGLRKKKYCILNVQYTKEEYEVLKEKIITKMKVDGEYGKFLPFEMSTVPFNFSTGMIYLPDTKREDIERLGGYWEELSESHLEGMATSDLPDRISDVPDTITKQPLICPETGWRFNIAQNELQFYRQKGIPLPREHFDVRTRQRLHFLTVITPFGSSCVYCNKDLQVYYRPEWGYAKIACEECYKQNIN